MGTKRHQTATDKIQAKDKTLKLIVGGLPQTYETFFSALDFLPDDIPNVRAVETLIGNLSIFNNGIIDFSTSGGTPNFTLSNYHIDYFPIYGNNPGLAIYTFQSGVEQQDLQTAPIINRITPGDRTSDITSIVWPYPIATDGYLIIDGFSGVTSSGYSGAIDIPFTDTDLIPDGSGGFYIEITLPTGKRPFYAESNTVEIGGVNWDGTTSPGRLYGFPDNTPTQVILVKVS